MAKRKAQPAVTDYIKAMYTTAQKLGYSIESITETISDKSNNVTSRIITGYRLTRKDIQFVANAEKNTALSSLQQVAKALIDKMHSIPTRLGDITVSESTESNAMEGQKEEAKEKESKAIKVQITPQTTNYMDMKHQHNEDKSLAYQEEKQATREEKAEGGYSWAKVGSTVYNKRNGVGIIDSIDGIIMQVKFQKETKRYIYPDAILDGLLKKGKRQTDVSMVSSLPETVLKRKELNNPEADLSEDNTIYDKAQLGAESLTKYLLTDESCVRNRVCPKCKYTLWLKRYNMNPLLWPTRFGVTKAILCCSEEGQTGRALMRVFWTFSPISAWTESMKRGFMFPFSGSISRMGINQRDSRQDQACSFDIC